MIHPKLDGILALFAEQKILGEAKEETAALRKKVELQIEEFKETFEKCSSRPKRVLRDLSVIHNLAHWRSILHTRCSFAV